MLNIPTWFTFLLNVETAEVRQRHYDAENLQRLFQEISVAYVFDVLHEIGLFYRIQELLVHDGM